MLLRRLLFALRTLALLAVLAALPRRAAAEQPGGHGVGVAVLTFDSEDAEDQAEAITGAIRSRVRNGSGWWLIDSTQSLGMLTAAFKCPSRPTPECQQKISDQIKAERYIYGYVSKGPQNGQVTAEVHFFQRGKAEQPPIKESFSDNLRDGNDDTLKKIAARIMDRLGGAALGTIVVETSEPSGDVIVDGEKRVPLDKGQAHIEVAAGGHSVELATPNGTSPKKNVLVTVGRETPVDLVVGAAAVGPGGAPVEQKSNTRKIIGGAVAGAGVVLGVIAVIELAHYFSLQSDGDSQAATLPKNDPVNGSKECREYNPRCMQIDKDSKTASGLAIGLGAAGAAAIGVGAYLFFTDPGSEKNTAKTRILPSVGPGTGSLTVVGTF